MSFRTTPVRFRFRLYIAGHTANSRQAIANLNDICREYLAHRHDIEIVDVFKDPARALTDGIMMTPTLLRVEPSPAIRVVGSLSAIAVVLDTLEILPRVPAPQT